MTIQLPAATHDTPYALLQSMTFSPPSTYVHSAASPRVRPESDTHMRSHLPGRPDLDPRTMAETPPPGIVLTSPPISPKSLPAPAPDPDPASLSTSDPDAEPVPTLVTVQPSSGRAFLSDSVQQGADDPQRSLAAFKFPGSYTATPQASAGRSASAQACDESMLSSELSPSPSPRSYRLPGSYDASMMSIDGDERVGLNDDQMERTMKRDPSLALEPAVDESPCPAPTLPSTAHRRVSSATIHLSKAPTDDQQNQHRRLTTIEAKQLAEYLTQQFSLNSKSSKTRSNSKTHTRIESMSSAIGTSASKSNAHKQKQKGMMEKSIAVAEVLHDAGIRWDKSRRVMGTHLRGIWEAAGGRSDLDLYVQGSFLTVAEDPHPLDDAPIPIPMGPATYPSLPKLTIQAGLFSALPVSIPASRESSPNPLLSIPLSGSNSALPTSMPLLSAIGAGSDVGGAFSRRKSFSGFRSMSRSGSSRSHGSRASISSFISVATSACTPRSAPGSEATTATAIATAYGRHQAGCLVDNGPNGRMEMDRERAGRPRASSAVSSLEPPDAIAGSLRAFRFPNTGTGTLSPASNSTSSAITAAAQQNGRATHRSSVSLSVPGQNPTSSVLPAFELRGDVGQYQPSEETLKNYIDTGKVDKKWNGRKMNVGLKIKTEGHQTTAQHQHQHQNYNDPHTSTSAYANTYSYLAESTSVPRQQRQPHTSVHHCKHDQAQSQAQAYMYTPYTSHSRTFHPKTPLTGTYAGIHGHGGRSRWKLTRRSGYKLPLYIDVKLGRKRFVIGRTSEEGKQGPHPQAHPHGCAHGQGCEAGAGWATPGLRSGGGGRRKGRRPRSARRVSFGGYEVR
ncbi:hypothetical protein IAU59_004903 [Kwoniella sp. CBS 9459]